MPLALIEEITTFLMFPFWSKMLLRLILRPRICWKWWISKASPNFNDDCSVLWINIIHGYEKVRCYGRQKILPITTEILNWILSLLRLIKRSNPRPYKQDIGMHKIWQFWLLNGDTKFAQIRDVISGKIINLNAFLTWSQF